MTEKPIILSALGDRKILDYWNGRQFHRWHFAPSAREGQVNPQDVRGFRVKTWDIVSLKGLPIHLAMAFPVTVNELNKYGELFILNRVPFLIHVPNHIASDIKENEIWERAKEHIHLDVFSAYQYSGSTGTDIEERNKRKYTVIYGNGFVMPEQCSLPPVFRSSSDKSRLPSGFMTSLAGKYPSKESR